MLQALTPEHGSNYNHRIYHDTTTGEMVKGCPQLLAKFFRERLRNLMGMGIEGGTSFACIDVITLILTSSLSSIPMRSFGS
jgi:hypothetical protein